MLLTVMVNVDIDTTDTDIEDMRDDIIKVAVSTLKNDPESAEIDAADMMSGEKNNNEQLEKYEVEFEATTCRTVKIGAPLDFDDEEKENLARTALDKSDATSAWLENAEVKSITKIESEGTE